MATMLRMFGYLLALCVTDVMCDYSCLCSYQVELEIFEKPDPSSSVDGYMYEFDCKPVYNVSGLDPKYSAVGNSRRLGYVIMSSNIQIQRCQGQVPDIDKVVMTSAPTTTTTPIPRTTTPIPTTKTTTPIPTTSTTTPKPTTTTPLPTTTATTTPMPTTEKTTPKPTTKTTTMRPTTTAVHASNVCRNSVYMSSLVETHGRWCYEFVNKTDNWVTARKDCQGKGGYLVSILNLDQQNFVASFLQRIHMRYPVWIGFTDSASEEHWRWDSGVNATYTNWMPGRLIEQFHDVENCGLLVPLRKNEWDDVVCTGVSYGVPARYPWICQFP